MDHTDAAYDYSVLLVKVMYNLFPVKYVLFMVLLLIVPILFGFVVGFGIYGVV